MSYFTYGVVDDILCAEKFIQYPAAGCIKQSKGTSQQNWMRPTLPAVSDETQGVEERKEGL